MTRTLAHISDLHFGTEVPGVVAGLQATLQEIRPDLVVLSGDLTQRAREPEFAAARRFLEGLDLPWLAVPGNHDLPLFSIVRRFVSPWARYRKFINGDLAPFVHDAEMAVLGINTASVLTPTNGRISIAEMLVIRNRFCAVPASVVKILVTHHPLIPPPGRGLGSVVGRAAMMLMSVQGCSPDLALAGHYHASYHAGSHTVFTVQHGSILVIQAGTAISARTRLERNAFNLIRIQGGSVQLSVYMWDGARFGEHLTRHFYRDNTLWHAA